MNKNILNADIINSIISENLPLQELSSGKAVIISGANGFITFHIVRVLIAFFKNKIKATTKFSDLLGNLKIIFNANIFTVEYIKSPSTNANFKIEKIKKLGLKFEFYVKTGLKRIIESYLCKENI